METTTRTRELTTEQHVQLVEPEGLSVIIPAYNEAGAIVPCLDELFEALDALDFDGPLEVLVVDDGSSDGTAQQALSYQNERLCVIEHSKNRGYGAALKTGIHRAHHAWVAIIDADGTYPAKFLGELLKLREGADMVVGARIGPDANIPLIRRPPKWVLRMLASALCGRQIPDLNSGLRIMRREQVLHFEHLLPNQFSFTTTITLAMLSSGYEVRYVPIDYRKRKGKSKIRPIADTLNFLTLIIRTVTYFNPLRVFLPVSAVFMALGVGVGTGSALYGELMDVTTVLLVTTGIQLLAVGMLADLIQRRP